MGACVHSPSLPRPSPEGALSLSALLVLILPSSKEVTSLTLDAFKSLLSHLARQMSARLTPTPLATLATFLCTFILQRPGDPLLEGRRCQPSRVFGLPRPSTPSACLWIPQGGAQDRRLQLRACPGEGGRSAGPLESGMPVESGMVQGGWQALTVCCRGGAGLGPEDPCLLRFRTPAPKGAGAGENVGWQVQPVILKSGGEGGI